MKKSKKLNYKDDFELLYLRHEYIKKAAKMKRQLDGALVQRYAGIVHTTAKIMFAKLKPNFQKVGFDEQDFVAITNMYMLTYMALYSIQTNADQMTTFLAKNKMDKISEAEILRVDRNRLINFLRQRLIHCSALFARKARNITVGRDKRGFFAETSESVGVSQELIMKEPKKYGYRIATLKEFRQAQKIAKASNSKEVTDENGFKMMRIEMLNQGIGEADYRLLTEETKGMFYNPPDVALQMMEEEVAFDAFKLKVEALPANEKRALLLNFVNKNEGNKALKSEISLARKLLKAKTIVV